MSDSEIDSIARRFTACTLPKSEWTHEAHLRVGLWHLLRFTPRESLVLLRDGIHRYNEASGTANSDISGYHETLTRFYVVLLEHFLQGVDRSRPEDELAGLVVESLGAWDLPLRYYSPDRLWSHAARSGWVEPDLFPLPEIEAPGCMG